jgi:hypothetical protein
MKKVILELSLVTESRTRTENEIISDIKNALSKENLIIPWCKKIENIAISSENKSTIELTSKKLTN